MSDDITRVISDAADRLFACRLALMLQRQGFFLMPPLIEIKGLSGAIATAKKGIAELRVAASGLNVESTALTNEINDITTQVKQHRADLRFEAETLGNSNGSEDSEKELEKPAASPEVGLPAPTFRAAE